MRWIVIMKIRSDTLESHVWRPSLDRVPRLGLYRRGLASTFTFPAMVLPPAALAAYLNPSQSAESHAEARDALLAALRTPGGAVVLDLVSP